MMLVLLVCVAMFAGSCAAAEEPRSLLTRRLATAKETGAEFTLLHTGIAKIQNDINRVKSMPANYLKVSGSLRKSKSCLMDVKIVITQAEKAAQLIKFHGPAKPFAEAAITVLQLAKDALETQDTMMAEPTNLRLGPWNSGFIYVYEGGRGTKIKIAVAAVDKKLGTLEKWVKRASTAAKLTGRAYTNVADVAARAGALATPALKHVDSTATSMYAFADKMEKIVSNAKAAYTKEFAKMEPFIKGVADAAAVVSKYEKAACIMDDEAKKILKLLEPIVEAMATKISIPCGCTPETKCKDVCTGGQFNIPLVCKCLGGLPSKCVPGLPAQCTKFGDILAEASAQDILDGTAKAVALLEDKAKALLKPLTDKLANVMPKLPFPTDLKFPTIDTSGLTAFADNPLVDMIAINDWALLVKAYCTAFLQSSLDDCLVKVSDYTEATIVNSLKGCSIPFLIQPSWDPDCPQGGVPSKKPAGGLATPEEFIQLKADVTAMGLKADGEVLTSGVYLAKVTAAEDEAKKAAEDEAKAAAAEDEAKAAAASSDPGSLSPSSSRAAKSVAGQSDGDGGGAVVVVILLLLILLWVGLFIAHRDGIIVLPPALVALCCCGFGIIKRSGCCVAGGIMVYDDDDKDNDLHCNCFCNRGGSKKDDVVKSKKAAGEEDRSTKEDEIIVTVEN